MTSSASQISSSQNSESKNIVQSIGTPEDRKAYRSYWVRKTSSLVQKCIAKGTKFPKYVVDLSKAFFDWSRLNGIKRHRNSEYEVHKCLKPRSFKFRFRQTYWEIWKSSKIQEKTNGSTAPTHYAKCNCLSSISIVARESIPILWVWPGSI